MPRRQRIPEELTRGPFSIAEAERMGFSRQRLRGSNWRRVGRGAYVWSGLPADTRDELVALHRRLPSGSVFSGPTAARLHGVSVDAGPGVHLIVPPGASTRIRPGVHVQTVALDPSEVTTCGSLPVTTMLRTCFDLARSLPLTEAVVAADAMLHRRLVTIDRLGEYVRRSPRTRGIPQARRVVELAEPEAESPMESRLRMVLALGGLPRPQLQVELRDDRGGFIGRPDLLYPEARLAIEYDGGTHRDSLVADNRRQNRLQRAGYTLLRYTGPDVYDRPQEIVKEVREQLARRR